MEARFCGVASVGRTVSRRSQDVVGAMCRIQRKWDGPKQYTDAGTKSLMMLPTDMALIWDKKLKPYVETYAKDQDKFFEVWPALQTWQGMSSVFCHVCTAKACTALKRTAFVLTLHEMVPRDLTHVPEACGCSSSLREVANRACHAHCVRSISDRDVPVIWHRCSPLPCRTLQQPSLSSWSWVYPSLRMHLQPPEPVSGMWQRSTKVDNACDV